MSLLPYIFRDMARPLRMIEKQMRLAEELFPAMTFPTIHSNNPVSNMGKESVVQDSEKFQMKLDMRMFKPQEIVVKSIDGSIIVEGKHDEKEDEQGFIARQFIRRFALPKGHEMKDAVSTLSPDGLLTITVPKKPDPELQERVIPITHSESEKLVGN